MGIIPRFVVRRSEKVIMRSLLLLSALVAVSSANYLGCYRNNGGDYMVFGFSDLSWHGNEWTGELTPELCQGICSGKGFNYFGLVWGEQCSCGNTIGGEKISDGECNTPCVGDASQMCGGSGEANPTVVYQIGDENPGTQPPTDPPTEPQTEAPTEPPTTAAPCLDTKPANWCNAKCNTEKKCSKKKNCKSKCQQTCGLCEEVTEGPTGPTTTRAPGSCERSAKYDYAEVLDKSMLFYEAQRAGPLPANNRIPWRGDSNLNDDPVGGYYDAGDFLKFGFPMAHMTTQLAWGAISFQQGYENACQLEYIKETIKWATDYFIDANRLPNEFIGQIGAGDADHGYWGRAEDMNMNRPVYSVSPSKPGSDLAGETAAALAAASIFYKNTGDAAAADEALDNAKELFEFADK